MKNKKEHLPIFGVGPIIVMVPLLCAIAALIAGRVYFKTSINVENIIIGIIMILVGLYFWYLAAFCERLEENINANILVTKGIYSLVRNPIYSAFLLASTGIIIMSNVNIFLILPVIFYLYMSIIIKNTEEKWLHEKFGEEYDTYTKRVNRLIPIRRIKRKK